MKKRNKRSVMSLVWEQNCRKYALGILLFEILSVIFATCSPWLQKYLIDGVNSGNRTMVVMAVAGLVCVLPGQFVFRSAGRFLRGILGVRVRTALKSAVFRHLLDLPEDFLRSRGAGYFFNRIQNDIGEVCTFISGNGMLFPGEMVKLFCALFMLAVLDWRGAVATVPFLLIQITVCRKFRERQYQLSRQLQECTASERHIMQEYLTNHSAVKTHNANNGAAKRIDQGLSYWGKLMRSRLNNESYFFICLQVPVWMCSGMILLGGLWCVMRQQSTLGSVWAMLAWVNLVFSPARLLGNIMVQQQAAASGWSRIVDLQGQAVELVAGITDRSDEQVDLKGDVIFRNVSFAYNNSRQIIKDFTWQVPYGSGVFLCGANGSGKSTIFSLLLRLYQPQSGEIMINNCPINKLPLGAYRSRIGYIGQHPEFIRGTLRENLLLGNQYVTDLQIMEVFEQLGCREIVERLPEKLDAVIAERGENFSGGERLRLALVRELLRDTDWLLFDEAAANLDLAGRQRFYELLQRLPGNKGVIAIAHDLPENSVWPILQIENLQQA